MSYINRRADLRDNVLYSAFFVVAFAPLWLILSINCGIEGICHWSITVVSVSVIIAFIYGVMRYIKSCIRLEKRLTSRWKKRMTYA